ncbi:hypothetical protein DVH24_018711 [Malus domestica]|uniref:RNase H type-1 domain-containing protein n=1 Tax=Malus domestica TaxID=3750 RepID=A0A498HIQ9_MALDO|nr:hypothetical protein DVH24_018711 [Malus domestica]
METLSYGSSLRLINHTHIAFIPKVDNLELVSNFRPISLVWVEIIVQLTCCYIRSHLVISWQNPAPFDGPLPNAGFVKLNFNGLVVNQQASFGFVIRNKNGSLIIVGARSVGLNTINVAKCLALRDGL